MRQDPTMIPNKQTFRVYMLNIRLLNLWMRKGGKNRSFLIATSLHGNMGEVAVAGLAPIGHHPGYAMHQVRK